MGILIILIVAACVFYWCFITIVKPLRELHKATRRIKSGDLDFKLETESRSEVGDLIRSFDEMRAAMAAFTSEKERISEGQRDLIRNIAHDLKTPITTIRGYSEGLLDNIADTPEKREKYLRTINNKANDMVKLIDELSYYSKIETNRIPYNFQRIKAKEFFDDCSEDIGDDLAGKDFKFIYINEINENTEVIADPEQINKVINNIIGNSVKYNDKENKEVNLTVFENDNFVECILRDNGRGISKADLPKIYERFYRADESRTNSSGGSGIGLSIAKKIIEDHGGSIWAQSEEGRGLTQHFILRKYIEQ
ncbi:MAG: HAMP domain-containing sensor histidine kinase [Eubacteriales bacterium]|nr:HAMP domain-containing sensor histidine kinase [Eubacteriales bacterium]